MNEIILDVVCGTEIQVMVKTCSSRSNIKNQFCINIENLIAECFMSSLLMLSYCSCGREYNTVKHIQYSLNSNTFIVQSSRTINTL